MLDSYIIGEVNRISPEAPVPVCLVQQKTDTLGGAGNVALNLKKLGCEVNLIGMRGHDTSGHKIQNLLHKNSITDNLVIDESHPTTTKTRILGGRQQLLRVDEEKFWQINPRLINSLRRNIDFAIKQADAVILSDYHKGALADDIPQDIIKKSRVLKKPVFVDPKGKVWERYTGATCITPNIAEVEEVSGVNIGKDETKLVEQIRILRNKYQIKWFLATRGAEGMCLLGTDDKPIFIRSVAREVFDVSGAGDTVIATFTAAVAGGVPFLKSAEIANVAAGIVVGKVGSQPIDFTELVAAWKSYD